MTKPIVSGHLAITSDGAYELTEQLKNKQDPVSAPPDMTIKGYPVVQVVGFLVREEALAEELRRWGIVSTSYQHIGNALKDTKKQIVLYVNSPGGQAKGMLKMSNLLYELRNKVAGVYIDELGTSAAYCIAASSGATITAADPETIVGGWGVRISEYAGESYHEVVNAQSPKKASMKYPEGRQAAQELADSMHRQMVPNFDRVNRPIDQVQGAAILADAAVDARIIDNIGEMNIIEKRTSTSVSLAEHSQADRAVETNSANGSFGGHSQVNHAVDNPITQEVENMDPKEIAAQAAKLVKENLKAEAEMRASIEANVTKTITENCALLMGFVEGKTSLNRAMEAIRNNESIPMALPMVQAAAQLDRKNATAKSTNTPTEADESASDDNNVPDISAVNSSQQLVSQMSNIEKAGADLIKGIRNSNPVDGKQEVPNV